MHTFLTILVMSSCTSEKANGNFLTICKPTPKSIRIEYLDSMNGISKVDQSITNDTLVLEIYVSKDVKNEGKEITLPVKAHYLKIDNREIVIDSIKQCGKVLSGEDVIKSLKK